jgi:hypothetical protein
MSGILGKADLRHAGFWGLEQQLLSRTAAVDIHPEVHSSNCLGLGHQIPKILFNSTSGCVHCSKLQLCVDENYVQSRAFKCGREALGFCPLPDANPQRLEPSRLFSR